MFSFNLLLELVFIRLFTCFLLKLAKRNIETEASICWFGRLGLVSQIDRAYKQVLTL